MQLTKSYVYGDETILVQLNMSLQHEEEMLIDSLTEWAQLNGIFLLEGTHPDREAVSRMVAKLRARGNLKELEGTTS